MSPTTVVAACYCGVVRFEASLPTKRIGHCHCDNCCRAHGAGVWTWATFPADRVRVVAGGNDLVRYKSETEAVRSFCRVCGSTLTYESPRWPGVIDLSLANFLQPLDAVPASHNYADRSPDWLPILDDLPQYGGPSGVEPLGEGKA
jgi:hypothetical protein